MCPCSNAARNNIEVRLTANGREVGCVAAGWVSGYAEGNRRAR